MDGETFGEEQGEQDLAFFSRTNTIEGASDGLTLNEGLKKASEPLAKSNDNGPLFNEQEAVRESAMAAATPAVKGMEAKNKVAASQLGSKLSKSVPAPSAPALSFKDNITEAPIGSLVEAEQISGDQVEIVQLTIVDRTQSLSDFQVLLQKHQIKAIVEPAVSKKKETSEKKRN